VEEGQVPSLTAGQSSERLLHFSMIHDQALIIHYEKYDQQACVYVCMYVYRIKQRSLLPVSANYCGHLQGGVQ